MTGRVVECRRRRLAAVFAAAAPPLEGPRVRGQRLAVLVAAGLVPVAGAAEPRNGFLASGLTALFMLLLAPVIGARAPWGWLAVGLSQVAVFLPRGDWPALGP